MSDPIPLQFRLWRDSLNRCKSTMFCKIYGHSKESTGRQKDFFEDTFLFGRYPKTVRTYFEGEVVSCKNPRCEWRFFVGEKVPWRTTVIEKGVEYELVPKSVQH